MPLSNHVYNAARLLINFPYSSDAGLKSSGYTTPATLSSQLSVLSCHFLTFSSQLPTTILKLFFLIATTIFSSCAFWALQYIVHLPKTSRLCRGPFTRNRPSEYGISTLTNPGGHQPCHPNVRLYLTSNHRVPHQLASSEGFATSSQLRFAKKHTTAATAKSNSKVDCWAVNGNRYVGGG